MNAGTRQRRQQKSKERKARKARKRQRKNNDCQPWPRFLLYAYHHEYDAHSPTSLAVSAYDKLRYGEWRVLGQDPSGPNGFCANNVVDRVKSDGGEAVYGWLLGGNGLQRQHDPNRFAGFKLVSHGVWRRPDGELCEITSGLDGAFFCPDESIPEITSQNVQFLFNSEVSSAYLNFTGEHFRCKLLRTDGTVCRDFGIVDPAFTYKLADTDLDNSEFAATVEEGVGT